MRIWFNKNIPLRRHIPSVGEGQGDTWIYGGIDGYKLLKRDPLLSQSLSQNILKLNTTEYSG